MTIDINVSEEVKNELKKISSAIRKELDGLFTNPISQIHSNANSIGKLVYELELFEKNLIVTEPAPAKHEWKAGDFFNCSEGLRQIVQLEKMKYCTINAFGYQMIGSKENIAEVMNVEYYSDAAPATIEEWFAAVRKAREANQ